MNGDGAAPDGWVHQQNKLIYGGLIGIGIVVVQPFITETDLDVSATICVVAFGLAIPLLAILLMVGQLPTVRHTRSVNALKGLGVLGGCVGVVAAFWHVLWIAGVVVLVSGVAGMTVYGSATGRMAIRARGGTPPTP